MNKSFVSGLLLLGAVLLAGIIGSGIFAQDTPPTADSFSLTATQIVINATARVLTPFSRPSILPPDLTYIPGIDPFTMQFAANATQFAVDQAANPTPGATIEGCTPGANIFSNNFELQNEFQAAFVEADLPVVVYISDLYTTENCVDFVGSPHAIVLHLTEAYSQPGELLTAINETVQIVLSHGAEFAYVSLNIGPGSDDTGRPVYRVSIRAAYSDLVANYRDGLDGLNLFLPRSE